MSDRNKYHQIKCKFTAKPTAVCHLLKRSEWSTAQLYQAEKQTEIQLKYPKLRKIQLGMRLSQMHFY